MNKFVTTLLNIRAALRTLLLGWFNPQRLENEQARRKLNEVIKSHWKIEDAVAFELIFENWNDPPVDGDPHYLVFIDAELDIDWTHERNLDDEQNETVTQAEAIGARRCKHLPREQVLEFKRLIGHAVVSGIRGHRETSRKLGKQAAQFLKERTIERSRLWTLLSAHCFLILLLVVYLSAMRMWPTAFNTISNNGTDLLIACAGGLLGAYLSIIQKAGTGEWDAASGFSIHLIEVFTKLIAGTVFGASAFVLTRSVHAPPSISALALDAYSIFLLGLAAGLIERLIPKMISNYTEKLNPAE